MRGGTEARQIFMAYCPIIVFGGSGFLGRRIVKRLATDGSVVKVAVRHPDRARFLERLGDVDQIVLMRADVRDEDSVADAVTGSGAVVNAVAAYVEKRGVRFAAVHEQGALHVARQVAKAGVERLVHISGIGADPGSKSNYIRSRGWGEALTREAFPDATILRPSVMFGPDDAFFNSLAAVVRRTPILPLVGNGRTRLQPVYVDDVAAAVSQVLNRPDSRAQIYELGGPRAYTLKELIELLMDEMGRTRLLLPIPFVVAELQALMMELLPSPPLTRGQVELLKQDNVVSETGPNFQNLGIAPARVENILPTYIHQLGRSKS